MKTTFSRTLISLAVILLTALLIIGVAFQFLIKSWIWKISMAVSRLPTLH